MEVRRVNEFTIADYNKAVDKVMQILEDAKRMTEMEKAMLIAVTKVVTNKIREELTEGEN